MTWPSLLTLAGLLVPPVLVFVGAAPPALCLVSLTTLVSLVFVRMREHAPNLMFIFALVAVGGTIAGRPWLNMSPPHAIDDGAAALSESWRAKGPFDERLPVVVHIVLDEMMSPGAIDTDLAGGEALQARMRTFAASHAFRLFEAIYSRFFFSGVSIPNMMDAEYEGQDALEQIERSIVTKQTSNRYFADMASRGYKTAVFQSAVIDFCNGQVPLCDTFASFDPATADESKLDGQTRTLKLWDALLRAFEPSYVSEYGRALIRNLYGLDQRELGVLGVADRFDVHAFPNAFERFTTFVASVPRGPHVFAHFLVPHSPYVLTNECVVAGGFDSGYYLGTRYVASERDAVRAKYYAQYFNQVQCVMTKLDHLMRAIESAPALRDAVVVIHGDHGSRISVGNHIEDYTPRDFIDNYAAFFAVRSPDTPPGIDCEFTALPQIFRRVMRGNPGAPEAPLPVLVSTQATEGARVEASMPRFGCAAGQ